MGMDVDKTEEENAFKFDDEDPRPEDRSAEEEEEGEQAGREDEGEEGRRTRMTAPMKVSDKEREEHELTHTPFRVWCPYCVRARDATRVISRTRTYTGTGAARYQGYVWTTSL